VAQSIPEGISTATLLACSDGSFTKDSGTGGHGWVFATDEETILVQGADPEDGHPTMMSSYQSELGGLLAVLYTLYKVCSYYDITSGKVRYYCDNKGVLRNVLQVKPLGISQYNKADADLVITARHLLTLMPITIVAEWVKGHYNGEYREYKHGLNDKADKLATSSNTNPHPNFIPKLHPIFPPNLGARLLTTDTVITSHLQPKLSVALHHKNLTNHMIKTCKLSDRIFSL
jgi:hypothetical protein